MATVPSCSAIATILTFLSISPLRRYFKNAIHDVAIDVNLKEKEKYTKFVYEKKKLSKWWGEVAINSKNSLKYYFYQSQYIEADQVWVVQSSDKIT